MQTELFPVIVQDVYPVRKVSVLAMRRDFLFSLDFDLPVVLDAPEALPSGSTVSYLDPIHPDRYLRSGTDSYRA